MPEPLKIAVVGAGFGEQVHIPALRQAGCEVVSIWSRSIEKAKQAAARSNIPHFTGNWSELVDDAGIAALSIAVPPDLQGEILLKAVEKSKPVFCEKPLAESLQTAQQIFSLAKRTSCISAVDFIFPELPVFQKAREILESNHLGRLRHAVLSWRVETYAYRAKVHNWKTQEIAGGTLNNFCSHSFYYLEWLLGRIEALAARLTPTPVEAHVEMWLKFASKLECSASIAADAFHGPGHRLEIYGEDGTLILENPTADYGKGFRLFIAKRTEKLEEVVLPSLPQDVDGRIHPVAQIARRFARAVRVQEPMEPSIQEGFRVQQLIHTARLAHEAGSWQAVAPHE